MRHMSSVDPTEGPADHRHTPPTVQTMDFTYSFQTTFQYAFSWTEVCALFPAIRGIAEIIQEITQNLGGQVTSTEAWKHNNRMAITLRRTTHQRLSQQGNTQFPQCTPLQGSQDITGRFQFFHGTNLIVVRTSDTT
ncbi:hypothetical protein D3C75_834490 [compost metagenome]